MALDNAKNFAKSTVSTGYNSAATSIVLSTGGGAKMPTFPFNGTWWNSTDYADPSDDPNVEIVRVTNIVSDTLTITRAQEGTIAANHNTGGKTYSFIAGLTAKTINQDLVSPCFGAYNTGTLSCSDGSFNKVQANQEDYDSHGWFDNSNYRFTPLRAGKYLFNLRVGWSSLIEDTSMLASIYKNGAEAARMQFIQAGAGGPDQGICGSAILVANGSTDYFEAYALQDNGSGSAQTMQAGPLRTYFSAQWLGD